MRILHVVPSYLPAVRYGGPIASVHGLCRALAARGHDVHVFTTNIDGPGDSDVPLDTPLDRDGVKVWYFASEHLRRLYWSPVMGKALRERIGEFEVAHLHSIFLWPTSAAAREARRSASPYIVAPRGMLEKTLIRRKSRLIKSAWLALVERRNLEHAAGIHVTSRREAAEMEAFGYRLPPIFRVPNGVDRAANPLRSAASPGVQAVLDRGPFLLFLGRVSWKKGLHRLVAALRSVPTIRLVVAGPDEERLQSRLMSHAEEYGVAHRVTFTGPVYGSDKSVLLTHARALVLPSYSENFGNVVLEAMASGCPVIATPEVGAADIIQEAGAGKVVAGEPGQLAAGLADLLSDPALLAAMGQRGRQAVESFYTWDSVARHMESAYAAAVAPRRS